MRTETRRSPCLHQLFEDQALRTPEAAAVDWQGEQLSYRDLDRQANALAHRLRSVGVGPEVLVGVRMERSVEMMVALLAVLKAGAAYLPLDPEYPPDRVSFMLEDAGAPVMLTQEALMATMPTFSGRVLFPTGHPESTAGDDRPPDTGVSPENLAYVIYTSGSTGRPKGVAITHRSITALLRWAADAYRDTELAAALAGSSISFDLSVFELFAPLARGGMIVLARHVRELPSLPAASRLTLVNSVPSAMAELIRTGSLPSSVTTVNFSGERLPGTVAHRIYEQKTVERIVNLYGPTETTVFSTVKVLERGFRGLPSIGEPIGDTQVYLLDSGFQPVHPGVSGEVYIGGVGLARGYLGRPDLTAERFVPDPFAGGGRRLYRTGDLARRREDGELEFLGRSDHQVKIRGFRIELQEIEETLRRHRDVRDVVVVAREDARGEKNLIAYVEGVPRPRIREWRRFLRQSLPGYMLPTAFVALPELPRTPNGKVDRGALPLPGNVRPDLEDPFAAPRTETERSLAAIWAAVFGIDEIGVHDDFLELGGHSLLATQIVSRVRKAFQAELPVRAVFDEPTVADLARRIDTRSPGSDATYRVSKSTESGDAPLSFSQERVWFIQILHPENRAYNFQSVLDLEGRLDETALRDALSEIVRRHEIFRTTFPAVDARPVQRVRAPFPVTLQTIDLRSLSDSARTGESEQVIQREIRRGFDLEKLPLVRWTLLRLDDERHQLIHVEHHLVHDGWSFNVFLKELYILYEAFSRREPSPLPDLPIQFADFARWQRRWLEGEEAERQAAFWKKTLQGMPPLLDLPADRTRPAVQSLRGSALRFELPEARVRAWREFSRRERVTVFHTMFAGFVLLLHRYTQRDDLAVGAGIANRRAIETEGLLGMIVNNLVLRTNLSGNPTVRELLDQVRDVAGNAYANQDLPFDRLVEDLRPERSLGHNPLYQVMFNFHDAPFPELTLPELSVTVREALNNGSCKFDMNVIVIPQAERRSGHAAGTGEHGMTVIWEYSTDLFDEPSMERMLGHYQNLLDALVADPGRRLSDLPLLSERERRQVLVEWNETRAAYPRNATIDAVFEAQAARVPGSPAIRFRGIALSYRELNSRANQVAHRLRKIGAAGERVGVFLERTPELPVALLGILKARAAYVPLDPTYPHHRLGQMIRAAGLRTVLTARGLAPSLTDHGVEAIPLDLPDDWRGRPAENLNREGSAGELAYVMFTSGSTGKPKGVAVPHRGVLRLLLGTEYVRLGPMETILHLAPISFDASTFEIWGALLHGATCVLFPNRNPEPVELESALKTEGVTTLWLTACLFNAIVDSKPSILSGVKQLLIGGEALSVDHVRRALRLLPSTRIVNGYGPTESTTFACCYEIPRDFPESARSVPIGRPIANTRVHLLDRHGNPVPVGVAGELHIGGDGLAQGYWDCPDLTAEKFVADPFRPDEAARLYRTGDLARYLPDGNIEFLGRLDDQVKIRGHRIEPAETEAVLRRHPRVREAAVVAGQDGPNERRLIAYVVVKEDPPVPMEELHRFLASRLPPYMIPAALVALDALPLTPSGKLDRRALPVPGQAAVEKTRVSPRNAPEEIVAEIWAEVLGLRSVGVEDNFFELGGHSLIALRILNRLQERLQVNLPIASLFEFPTVAALAQRCGELSPNPTRLQNRARRLIQFSRLSEAELARLVATPLQEKTT